MHLMCWPFSKHSSGVEPPRIDLEIVDPQNLYFEGSIACEIQMYSSVLYAEDPEDWGPPPIRIAREVIDGLRADDVLRPAGYPEQERASLVVIREGEVIAAYGIVRYAGDEEWQIRSGTACPDSGLPYAGESFG
jgi:hypothetical protein